MISESDRQNLEQAKPYILTLAAFIIWLKEPTRTPRGCLTKAHEFWSLIQEADRS